VPVKNQTRPESWSFLDKGLSDPLADGPAWVGADAKLLTGSLGTFAVYQNSTAADLRLARREGSRWIPMTEWTDGAVGFFADIAELDGKLYIVHTRMHARLVGGKPVPDNSLQLEIVTP
jgi:hypothetical protein